MPRSRSAASAATAVGWPLSGVIAPTTQSRSGRPKPFSGAAGAGGIAIPSAMRTTRARRRAGR